MDFSFIPLGVSAAQPAFGRHLAAHILSVEPDLFLIDCGEGTQFQLSAHGVKRHRIRHIFISHLHGDHFFGLIGLLTSMGMSGREEPLTVFAHPDLEEMIGLQMRITGTRLPYELSFQHLAFEGLTLILETARTQVFSFPLDHRTPTAGFLFKEKPIPLNILPEAIERYGLSFEQIRKVKAGEDLIMPDGRVVSNGELTLPPYQPRSFAYCSDTAYVASLAEMVGGVDLLYHESTFLDQDADLAAQTWHSTALQAARLAEKAGAGTLILGHFSARYPDAQVLLDEARTLFPQAVLAEEGCPVNVLLKRKAMPASPDPE